MRRKWDRCINHRGDAARDFVNEFFSEEHRRTLLIAGAGFDPRASVVCQMLVQAAADRVDALFIREERPNPAEELIKRAEQNLDLMIRSVPKASVVPVDVFASDGATVGGRNAISAIYSYNFKEYTDIVVDFSSLSIGVAFPIVRHLYTLYEQEGRSFNLHVMVTDEPSTDEQITLTASDTAEMIFGFRGGWGLFTNSDAARLWIPQLVFGRRAVLERVRTFIDPHDVCPVLPFPAAHPRLADSLIEHYIEEFESTWSVDARSIVYADESKPLDLYRTILRIDDARKRVFAETGGSQVVLSPLGSKVLAIGALMAAIERDFPVAHTEAIAYSVDFTRLDSTRRQCGEVVHVWLCGEAYPD